MVVAHDGALYVNTWFGRYYGNGKTVQTGGRGGTGIGFYKDSIYAEINDRIVRYPLPFGSIVPQAPRETIVSGLPLGGDHPMHPFIIDSDHFTST